MNVSTTGSPCAAEDLLRFAVQTLPQLQTMPLELLVGDEITRAARGMPEMHLSLGSVYLPNTFGLIQADWAAVELVQLSGLRKKFSLYCAALVGVYLEGGRVLLVVSCPSVNPKAPAERVKAAFLKEGGDPALLENLAQAVAA